MTKHFIRNGLIVFTVVAAVVAVARFRQTRSADLHKPTLDREVATAQTARAPRALPRMVDLGADKCIPCKKMAPILAELKIEYAGKAIVEFIDVWKNPEAGKRYDFRVIPTQVFFDRDGREVWRHEGFLPKDEIIIKLKELGAG